MADVYLSGSGSIGFEVQSSANSLVSSYGGSAIDALRMISTGGTVSFNGCTFEEVVSQLQSLAILELVDRP